jgi:hypothetical protein
MFTTASKKHADVPHAKLSAEFKPQFLLPGDPSLRELAGLVVAAGAPAADAATWVADQLAKHAAADIMIVAAKVGRELAGFVMLEPETLTASYSYVPQRFRYKGLGERFYSFACVNLGAPSPVFVYPVDMADEYAGVIRQLEIEPEIEDGFCTLNPQPKAA